ncbi:MAG: uracil-DNA glycosylase [Candidatus Yonathbacteria bacterium]|nr:uracil-DNA glycosylase [Candidatus Yonathbacteria bacterium]
MEKRVSKHNTDSSLLDIANEIRSCEKCPLFLGRLHAVPGEGSAESGIVFIGEGPGKEEDKRGKPFVGAAGKLLDEMLAEIGLKRDSIFITNIVKCRPPGNRDPEPDEVRVCTESYLWRQLEIINPKILITLGRHAMHRFIPADKKISVVHGKLFRLKSPTSGKTFNVLPQYHPAAALYNGGMRGILMKDFKKIPRILKTLSS